MGHEPADLAATLRELAVRAHRAVRSVDAASGGELADLHPRIVDLRRGLDEVSQRGLVAYLDALRRAVESRMG